MCFICSIDKVCWILSAWLNSNIKLIDFIFNKNVWHLFYRQQPTGLKVLIRRIIVNRCVTLKSISPWKTHANPKYRKISHLAKAKWRLVIPLPSPSHSTLSLIPLRGNNYRNIHYNALNSIQPSTYTIEYNFAKKFRSILFSLYLNKCRMPFRKYNAEPGKFAEIFTLLKNFHRIYI